MAFGRKGKKEQLLGHVGVDSAQILVMDPVNLPGDAEAYYQRVVDVTISGDAGGEVKFDPAALGGTDGVVVVTGSDGGFPVYAVFGDDGTPVEIVVRLTDADE
jgi:hypothetical protein